MNLNRIASCCNCNCYPVVVINQIENNIIGSHCSNFVNTTSGRDGLLLLLFSTFNEEQFLRSSLYCNVYIVEYQPDVFIARLVA